MFSTAILIAYKSKNTLVPYPPEALEEKTREVLEEQEKTRKVLEQERAQKALKRCIFCIFQ